MSDTQIEDSIEVQESHLPGVVACVFAKIMTWIILAVGVFYGVRFAGPFLKSGVREPSSLTSSTDAFGYVFISCTTSAIVLFVLIAICENLIVMNKRHYSK